MPNFDEHQKQFLKILDDLSYRHSGVLNDWAETSAISLYNAVTLKVIDEKWAEREDRYLRIVKQYDGEQVKGFCEMFACVAQSLNLKIRDVLGEMYMTQEMRSRWDSDVCFTPWGVSYAMAKMTFSELKMPDKGYLTICEPASGTGGLVIAAAQALKDIGHNFQQVMHVTATEVRAPLAHMAYIQFSLLHIPAVVNHGNSLSLETWSRWHTPAHVLGLWGDKLRRDQRVLESPARGSRGKAETDHAGICTNMQEAGPQFTFDFGAIPATAESKKKEGSKNEHDVPGQCVARSKVQRKKNVHERKPGGSRRQHQGKGRPDSSHHPPHRRTEAGR